MRDGQKTIVGVMGGMGPLASSEFIKTVYEMHAGRVEQEAPTLILYSDPTIPDRTESFLNNRDSLVLEPFLQILRVFQDLHVSKIVVCCITSHYLFPKIPEDLRKPVISLVDKILSALIKIREKHLLLCTSGTLQLQVFQNHPLWNECKEYVLIPNYQDQQLIHQLIYKIKANGEIEKISPNFVSIFTKYQVDSFIVGCTEIHLLAKHLVFSNNQRKRYKCIDPLVIVAKELNEEGL